MVTYYLTQASWVISLLSSCAHYELVGYWDIPILGRSLTLALTLLTRNLYLMGEAPLEAPSSREVIFEPESSDTKHTQEQEQEEEYEYTLSEEEDLEAARVEAGMQ